MGQFRMIDISGPEKVRIKWGRETPRDENDARPDERDQGFWPSRDPNAAGYVGPNLYDDEQERAEIRMEAWENGEWEFVGVVAVAHVAIPVGGGSYALHTFRSPGLWGIESDAGDYLDEVFEEEKAGLLGSLKAMGAALASGDYQEESV